jgi:hypothetical protein
LKSQFSDRDENVSGRDERIAELFVAFQLSRNWKEA